MLLSTLCYIEKDNKYLMLHRTKKKNDINKDKWIGIGGKFEKNEVTKLNTWEGDKIFIEKMQKDNSFFTVKFEYDGDKLLKYKLEEY